ncbi:MAG: aldehyde ferredoxin oxidoreductase family protein [Chloroflexi bacterium]|nr:aldehyde ferredoxin oxidoreductase family protein [Chloroflexota bacterium]
MPGGYMGKFLYVDLSSGKIREESPDESLLRKYIGGYGVGARILYDSQPAGIDPLGPQNTLGFTVGPLTGTPTPSGTRYTVVAKSPLTGTWGDANSGGTFGPKFKMAGFDAVFLSGASEKPVYLLLDDGKAELRDAGHLWGKDTFVGEDMLREEFGKETEASIIGPSGEKLSLISCPMNNKGRAPGRSGLGAVLGSKRLKAIVARGDRPIPLADEKLAAELRRKYLRGLSGPTVNLFRNFGTPGITAGAALSGDSPVKNWGGIGRVDFPDPEPINGDNVIAQQQRKYVCYRCPLGCGGVMKAGKGEYQYPAGAHKPEYETLCTFGALCLNNDLESIIKANDICNRYGLDTISAGCVVAFAIECYENGILTLEDTDGIDLRWGNHRGMVAVLDKLARREGIGDVLADGVAVAAAKLGNGAEQYAVHYHGQEPGMHDPKLGPSSLAVSFKMDATPGRHTQAGARRGAEGLVIPDYNPREQGGRGPAHRIGSAWGHVVNSVGVCMFMSMCLSPKAVQEFMAATTGWDISVEEMVEAGERISNLRQAFNLREGVNMLEFRTHDRVLGNPPQAEGPLKGVTIDEELMISDYLKAMDWDLVSGKPSRAKLASLGLDDVAKDLWGHA